MGSNFMCTSQGLLSGQKVSCLQCIWLNNRAGMRKGVVMKSLTAEILIDCGNFMLAALIFSVYTC